ncbi:MULTISPECIES: inorganic phosphate transporter [Clostridium]|uniref:inorganic phosphate transporter n=1 Tax=Clostridium TaxID=1485 RepID=UPI00069E12AA|nr:MULTISPECIES: inorganic phosphate transporter [Clostridium]KOF57275.1 inorganic phosphate transporter [Clostridium sp. DMHC 10]MCD2347479.1 inorganic phosphate transporter [Clostridium guangxiense]
MLNSAVLITIVIVMLALTFDFINGFHDSANAIATSVSTRVLSMRSAVIMSACMNFLGAFISDKVAKTVGDGIIDPFKISPKVVLIALIAAIIWDLVTWYIGIPSSSSHALIGGLIGSAVVYKASFVVVNWVTFMEKIVLWLFLSPIIGFLAGYIVMILLQWILRRSKPMFVSKFFSKAQIVSAMLMALNHGGNDAQKSMGVITMALLSIGSLNSFSVPDWVKAACALAMALGTSFGGYKIIKTMGMNMARLAPVNGFAAETGAAAVIFSATMFHAPVSTTQIISTSIMGVAASNRMSSVRWMLAKNIVIAWVVTMPVCAGIAGLITLFVR